MLFNVLKMILIIPMTVSLTLKYLMLLLKNQKHLKLKLLQMKMGSIWFALFKPEKLLWLPGFALVLVLVCPPAFPQTAIGQVNLPSTPAFPQGQDRVKAADGTECVRSTAPRSKWAEVGIVGSGTQGQGVENSYPFVGYNGTIPSAQPYNRAGGAVYGRIIINLDANQPDLDCNYLYTLEIERLKAELEQARLIGVGKAVAK